jgi:hypothetical protein
MLVRQSYQFLGVPLHVMGGVGKPPRPAHEEQRGGPCVGAF